MTEVSQLTVAGAPVAPARIAVIIPCWNEEVAIRETVQGLRAALPSAAIYVYDNESSDLTAARAREAGAIVRRERRQGKGHVVRRMFADVEADVYLMVDGDATYQAGAAAKMVELLLEENLAMVVGRRVSVERSAYRRGHAFGNHLLTAGLKRLFGGTFTDVLSGARVFSRRFVKSFPATAMGFEIEAELTVHALMLGLPSAELDIPYCSRPSGSASKLRTFRDGARIALLLVNLLKNERPLVFFGSLSAGLAAFAVWLSLPVFAVYLQTGLVPRFPTAILSASIMVLAALSLACGLVLDLVSRSMRDMKRLAYLQLPGPDTAEVRARPTAHEHPRDLRLLSR